MVIRPGRLAGGCVGGWTIPLTGVQIGSLRGGARSTLTSVLVSSVLISAFFVEFEDCDVSDVEVEVEP